MTNTTIEAYLMASTRAELNELPLSRSRFDSTTDRIDAQLDAMAELLAEAQHSYQPVDETYSAGQLLDGADSAELPTKH